MKTELEKLLSELRGMKRILDRDANAFPVKNKAWIQGEIVDEMVERIDGILQAHGGER